MNTKNKKTVEKKHDLQNGVRLAFFTALAILIQVLWLFVFFTRLNSAYPWLGTAVDLLAVALVLVIYGLPQTAAMKMPWMILILVFPFFGVFLYLLTGLNGGLNRMRLRYKKLDDELYALLPQNQAELDALAARDPCAAGQSRYIRDFAHYPLYQNTQVEFYPDAAEGLAAQLAALQNAQHFIFMEYHAIEDSTACAPLLALLRQKAADGVEVRVFYDYVGSMGFVGNQFAKKLEGWGIQCRVFNPMLPVVNLFLNNRDHRKITVIDGVVGFTGGYNLADEYFHVTAPYGHWLDTGVKLTGPAVNSLTVTFLENWNAIRGNDVDDTGYARYLPAHANAAPAPGLVQPYADSPLDGEQVGENVYMNVLRGAKRYAWFVTPYLIITDELASAFAMAAKSGVDVRIITPGIPDKKLVYQITRSYYAGLAQSGVRIFEYTPGFCHAKQCVCDDVIATCGTINLDFRSLYHHFENGVWLYGDPAVAAMKRQFDGLFPQCREVTQEYRTGRSRFLRWKQLILRLFAPLM